ncbi:MAG: RNA polymerase factor sigma-54, partial [Pseudomonadota bacterium]
MKQSLQLRIGTQLAMTPQLQQAIRLLQLSTLELQAEVQETLDSNYMLEAAEEESANAEADGPSEASDVADANDVSTEDVLVAESTGSAPDETPSEPDDIPSELPVDSAWDDIYDGPPTAAATNADSAGYEFDNHGSSDETLRDHLIWQMEMTYFSDTDRVIASSIIDSIRDDGYLSSPVEEIWESLHTPDNG